LNYKKIFGAFNSIGVELGAILTAIKKDGENLAATASS
jgi:hypothetical protein